MITENILITPTFSWIDIEHPLRMDFEFLKNEFKIPPLIAQDCLRPEHLPKYENTPAGYFFLTRTFDIKSKEEHITVQELTNKLAIFITKDRLLTIHNDELPFLRRFAENVREQNLNINIFSLTHELFKAIILTYEDPIERMQSLYEEFESEVLSQKDNVLSNTRVYHFRRQLFVIKGLLQLTQNSISSSKEFWDQSPSQLQDLKETMQQLYFRLDDLSHNFDQLFELYLLINEHRSNEVTKVLTVFASIMLPLTFIASFYGMNFKQLPGVQTTSGFIGTIVVMITITFCTAWYFNRKRWFKPSMQ